MARGLAFLLDEAAAGFPEACHRMSFPHWAGFTGNEELQAGDVFTRAVLAGVLLDVAGLALPETAARLRAVAREEAAYVARARLAHRRGGWSYFPDLPELPPDLDSLAAVITLFARAAPELGGGCDGPLAVAWEHRTPEGAVGTWLVSADDAPQERATMLRGIAEAWGPAVDVDVCARFFRALVLRDPDRYAAEIAAGIAFVLGAQEVHGGWPSTWYAGEAYGDALCLELLAEAGVRDAAVVRGVERVASLQRPDGGWGPRCSFALDTAVAMWVLAGDGRYGDRLARGRACLLDLQTAEGFWEGTPWIVMNTGRARGLDGPIARYRCTTLTTACCVRALLATAPDTRQRGEPP